jgi:hypothetical protein
MTILRPKNTRRKVRIASDKSYGECLIFCLWFINFCLFVIILL